MKKSIYGGTKILLDGEYFVKSTELKSNSCLNKLNQCGIHDWEQVYSLLTNNNTKELLLRSVLKLSNNAAEDFTKSTFEIVSKNFKAKKNSNYGELLTLGARKPTDEDKFTRQKLLLNSENAFNINSLTKINKLDAFLQHAETQLASSVNYISQLPPIKSQGERGTCVSFAVTVANEFSFYRKNGFHTDLSEQYLFSETKKLENDKGCGAFIGNSLVVLSTLGQCPESVWSYNPNFPCVQTLGKPNNADHNASNFKNGYVIYNPSNDFVLQIKGSLTIGQLVPFSIPVFSSWYQNNDTIRTGRIILPLPNELPLIDEDGNIKGHAMTIVGFQDSNDYPGGGYFIIRNSWGTEYWGKYNVYGSGYGIIPYDFLRNHRWEVFAV